MLSTDEGKKEAGVSAGFRDQEEEEQQNEKKKCGFTVCIDKEPCKSGSVSIYCEMRVAFSMSCLFPSMVHGFQDVGGMS